MVPEYFLSEGSKLLRLVLVSLQILSQKVMERVQCVSLKKKPLQVAQTVTDGWLESSMGAQLLQEKKKKSPIFGLIRLKFIIKSFKNNHKNNFMLLLDTASVSFSWSSVDK